MKCHRLLVTAVDDDDLYKFHLPVCMALNAIERRGNTVLYTCMEDDLAAALKAARIAGVTVQQRQDKRPYWIAVVQGKAATWKAAILGGDRHRPDRLAKRKRRRRG